MELITTKTILQQHLEDVHQSNKTIGFVPTMGALHDGHIALFKRAIKENDITVGSVFVNPTQFNNAEDLQKYPRDINKDAKLLARIGVDYVFAPTPEEMYEPSEMNQRFSFDFNGLDQVMEGAMRPGHFNGVVQVVSKLFHLVKPTRAYFGEKDFQQLTIIHYMVEQSSLKDTFGDLKIIDCPIVRAMSGLALSSRNERLSQDVREKVAPQIYRILSKSKKCTSVKDAIDYVEKNISAIKDFQLEYYKIVDKTTLRDTDTLKHAVGCIALWCHEVRLIDNVQY